jgi:hypothetical protein
MTSAFYKSKIIEVTFVPFEVKIEEYHRILCISKCKLTSSPSKFTSLVFGLSSLLAGIEHLIYAGSRVDLLQI